MSVSAYNTLRKIAEESGSDPRGAVLRAIGDYSHIKSMAAQMVLVATYIRPEVTKGGIIRPDKALAEDRYQGKVGLVLKLGSLAFKDDAVSKFGDFHPEVGDWVNYRPSDGTENFHVAMNGRDGTPIRWIPDTSIICVTDDPERFY